MKIQSFYQFMIVFTIIIMTGNAAAQNFPGGVVTYQQTTRYDFAKIFNIDPNAGGKGGDWIASLPTELKKGQILSLTPEKALYREDTDVNNAMSRKWNDIMLKVEDFQPTQVKVQKVFWDLDKNESIRQIEFMSRYFLISDPIEKNTWKLTRKLLKIQNYVCTAAEMTRGEDRITAWFTSEIPVSIGPADYSGLPGLILAVDVNGETAFLATSVDLTKPKDGDLSIPSKGKKMSREEFDKIVEEKVKEWEETRLKGKGGNRKK